DPLWELVQAAYEALNRTNPNATASCWLCYDIRPPFYEAIGLNSTFNLTKDENPLQCQWEEKRVGLTVQQVRGEGVCVG
ncbi:ENV1 protein, partial [Crypturellus soui]|nr:ENV1 protein [Crypturellus soui]